MQIHQKTVKTLDRIKSLIRKSNKIFSLRKRFDLKNKNKGENSATYSPHQIFENNNKTSTPCQVSEKKSINATEKYENCTPHINFENKNC